MHSPIRPVPIGRPSFLGALRCTALELLDADIAILGMPFTSPDDLGGSRFPSSSAPDTIRAQSERLAHVLTHYDFDLGGSLFDGQNASIVDCGDISGHPGEFGRNSRAATGIVELVREAGALPVLLGGDHAAIVPALRAYADQRSMCVVHLGADLHWNDGIDGARESARSGMRRASEMPWVMSTFHIGMRGVGSTRQQDVDAAVTLGSEIVRAEELHRWGVEAVLERVPVGAAYYICLDADALDPSIAPGVELPAFGGLSYFEANNLLRGLVARGPLVGLAVLGVVPSNDVNDITSLLAARLVVNVLGALVRANGLHTRPSTQQAAPLLVRN